MPVGLFKSMSFPLMNDHAVARQVSERGKSSMNTGRDANWRESNYLWSLTYGQTSIADGNPTLGTMI
jgi:hypothetical protein